MYFLKNACSLGPLCQSSQILKDNKIKTCSYPFDWIFSDCDMILHCIKNDFNKFLDKGYYNAIAYNRCGHSYYHNTMFNHHNPLENENDYEYFRRCICRFKELLNCHEPKLFIMTFINMDHVQEELKNKLIEFNNNFAKYTKNYVLLVIFHIKHKKNNHHDITYHDNIHFLELHTISHSNGKCFHDNNDTTYLNNIINQKYKLSL